MVKKEILVNINVAEEKEEEKPMNKIRAMVAIAVLCAVALVAIVVTGNQRSVRASTRRKATAASTVTLSPNVPVDIVSPPPNPPAPPPSSVTQDDWLNFGWQTFVALDWPALSPNSGGVMGQPDPSSNIGATASNRALVPAVWNTFRDVSTIMLANGADPGATYNQPVTIPSGCPALGSNPVAPGFQPLYIDNSTFSSVALTKDYVDQAFTAPLVDQEGWYAVYQILIAPSEYAYIENNKYFNGANQARAYTANGQLAGFPFYGTEFTLPAYAQYGALEIKAAWRVLDPVKDANVIGRYYTQWGYFMQQDGTTCEGPNLFGLVGLHILRLTPSTGATWFWASFQQVDNATSTPASGSSPAIPATFAAPNTPTNGNCSGYNERPGTASGNILWPSTPANANNICQVNPIPTNVQQVNQNWQAALKGTVWQYYQMVNTLNPCPNGASGCATFPPINDANNQINVNAFSNAVIESYAQASNGSSQGHTCMGCHGSAAGDGLNVPLTGTNQIFTFVLQNAYWDNTTAAAAQREKLLRLLYSPLKGTLVAPKAKTSGKYNK